MSSKPHSGLDYLDKPAASANYGRVWPQEKLPQDVNRLGAVAALQCELIRLQPCDAIRLLLDRTREIAGADLVTLGLFEGAKVVYRYASGAEIGAPGLRLDLAGTLAERCVRTGSILAFDTPTSFPVLNGEYRTASSGIVCPIFNDGKAVGTLEAFSSTITTSDDSDIDLVQIMAGLLGGVLAEVAMQAMKHVMVATSAEVISDLHPNLGDLVKPNAPVKMHDPAPRSPASLDPQSPSLNVGSESHIAQQSEEWDDLILSERENDLILLEFEGEQAGLEKGVSHFTGTDDRAFGQQELPQITDTGLDSLRTSLIAGEHVRNRNSVAIVAVGVACVILTLVLVLWRHFRTVDKPSAQIAQSLPQRLPAAQGVETPKLAGKALSIPASALGLSRNTPSSAQFGGTTQLVGIRYWKNEDGAAVALQLTGKTQVEAHRMSNPDRIYFDLHNTALWQSLNGTRFKVDGPLLSQVRASDRGSSVTRVTLQLQNPANYEIKTSDDPNLLVIEVRNPISRPN